MSRMTKYLRQTCQVEAYQLDEKGDPDMDRFGNIIYSAAQTCKCRHETAFQDIQTANGSIVTSVARYYLDESLEIKADYRIDGRAVLTVSTLVNEKGLPEGYEVYV